MLTQDDFTTEFCANLIAEYGEIKIAAQAIAPQCRSSRYSKVALSWRTVEAWISKHVGPRRLRALPHPIFEDARDINDPNRVRTLIESANVPIDEIGRVAKIKLSSHGVPMKLVTRDATGKIIEEQPHVEVAHSKQIVFTPREEALVGEPYISSVRAFELVGLPESNTQRVFIVGDQQLGFWAVRDPQNSKHFTFVPFHDEQALMIMMQALALYAPDLVVIVGDFLDYPQLSRFQQEPEFEQTMQATIDAGELLIAKIRKTVGDVCEIIFVPGNHETRMQRAIVNGNRALYELKRPGEKYAIYSVASLLGFEKHRIEMMAEYPSGQYWIAKRRGNIPGLVVTHADPRKSDMRADSIHGHLVLPGIETFAREYEDGWVTYTRMCVSGCANYSDTGDKVRLTRTHTPSGRSRMASVQSFATVDIDRDTGQRSYGLHLIRNGQVSFLGKILGAPADKAA